MCFAAGEPLVHTSATAEDGQQEQEQQPNSQAESQPSAAATSLPASSGGSSSHPSSGGPPDAGGGGGDDPRRPTALPLPSLPAFDQAAAEAAMLRDLGLHTTQEQREQAARMVQRSQGWHIMRCMRLTSSEIAAAVGASHHMTPHDLIQRKLATLDNMRAGRDPSHGLFSSQQQRRLAHGIAAEPLAAFAYFSDFLEAPVGASIGVTGFYIHPAHAWLGTSPDRVLTLPDGSSGLVEIKCPANQALPEQLPHATYIQALAQLACQPPGVDWQWVDVFYWTSQAHCAWRVHWNSTTQQEWRQHILPRAHHWFFTQFAPAALRRLSLGSIPAPQQQLPGTPPPETPAPPPSVPGKLAADTWPSSNPALDALHLVDSCACGCRHITPFLFHRQQSPQLS
jgi:hypothetical protein